MRKFIFLLLLISFAVTFQNTFAQFANWSPLKRLTYGYKDSNPDFSSTHVYSYMNFSEFMVFQRKIDTASQICVIRFINSGPVDSGRYITSNNFVKRNPAVAYRQFAWNDTNKYALALWESNQNGKWDIYGSYYSYPSGWSAPFPVDSGAGNKFNPKVSQISTTDFGIVYTKDNDIIYRRYNAQTKTVVNETNITSSIPGECSNSLIAYEGSESLRLNFRSKKIDNNYNIYRAYSTNFGSTWYLIDTIVSLANNSPVQLGQGLGIQQIFESNRNGKIGIYGLAAQGPPGMYTVINSTFFNYYGFKFWAFPILTDAMGVSAAAVVRKSNDLTKIMFCLGLSTTMRDSVSVGDTSKNVTIALNSGMKYNDLISFFAVFNLDTAGETSLYYKYKLVSTTDIKQTGTNAAEDYKLYQNYPNPFNPTTKIKFDIPKLSDVKIVIFDAVGRGIKNISKNNMTAGSYEYELNGENLSSGIYYFKLETNGFVKTVKMVLMK